MIKIYAANETSFIGIAITDIDVLSAKSKSKINGLYTLNFTIPVHYATEIIQDRIVEADGQYYRILKITKKGKYKETLEVYCENMFQVDMLDEYAQSFMYSDKSVEEILTLLLEETIYKLGTCSDLKLNAIAITQASKSKILSQVLQNWQGELNIDELNISIKSAIGENRGVEFKKGKNLKSIEAIEDISNVITKLHYANKEGNIGGVIESPNMNVYSKPKVMYQEFDAKTQEELDLQAQLFLSANDKPYINYKVDFADLYYTEEYASVKDLEKVELGDRVTIEHDTFGINIPARIIELEKDIATHKNTKVVLGNFGSNFFDFQLSLNEIKNTVNYAFADRKLNAATLKGLRIVNEEDNKTSFEVTEQGKVNITGDALIGGTLDANKVNIINFTADTGEVYYVSADNAKIMKLTVNELMTMMIEEGGEEYHYIHVHNEVQEWKSAFRKYYENGTPYPDIHLTDNNGDLLYWVDENRKTMTLESADSQGKALEPVMVHQYDYITKMEILFDEVQLKDGTFTKAPMMWWGNGTGDGNNGRCRLFKDLDGFSMNYYSGVNGEKRVIDLNDKGIDVFVENGDITGITDSLLVHKNETSLQLQSSLNQVDGFSLNLSSDSNLKFTLTGTCTAIEENKLEISLSMDGVEITKFYFNVFAGENSINFNYPLTKMQEGKHDLIIDIKDNDGTTIFNTGNFITYIEGRNIEGGVAPMYPKARVVDVVNFKFINEAISDSAVVRLDTFTNEEINEVFDLEDIVTNISDEVDINID